MEWTIKFHKNAKKFLRNLEERKRNRILHRLKELRESLSKGVIPWKRLHIRKLRGEWEGYLRMRVGEIRIIFEVDIRNKVLWIYHIHYREKVYQRNRNINNSSKHPIIEAKEF